MVVRLPYKSRDKPLPNESLPSISEEMQKRAEAEQSNIRKQLEHAQQQIDLTKSYPSRRGDTRSTYLLSTFHSSLTCGFAPKATEVLRCCKASLCAKSRLHAPQQTTDSLQQIYSMTSSAATSRPGGTVSPRAFAVLI